MLLQLGRELHRRSDRFWLTIGGGAERGETLAEAAAREMREEAGIDVDPAELGEPIGTTVIEYSRCSRCCPSPSTRRTSRSPSTTPR